MPGYIPYLSSPANGSPMATTLRDRTVRRANPDANKGTQVLHISQRWTQK
jgi:hypothetical protein